MGSSLVLSSMRALALLAASLISTTVAIADDDAIATPESFRIAGYLPDYRLASYDLAKARGLSDLIVFSAEPTAEGDVDLTRLQNTPWTTLQRFKTQNRIRLILSIGGWERSQHFATIATSPDKTIRFADSVVRLCLERRLDGIDIDWEHPQNEAEQTGYGTMLTALKSRLDQHGLMLSVTIAAWQQLPDSAIAAVDWVNLMAYDHDGPHSTMDGAKDDVRKLLAAGVPSSKITLGLPFYGRHIKDRSHAESYRELLQRHRLAPESDEVDQIAFNGPLTIRRKTEYAHDAGLAGVMIWELGQDAEGDASLLNVVQLAVRRFPAKQIQEAVAR